MTTITIPRELLVQAIAALESTRTVSAHMDAIELNAIKSRADSTAWRLADHLRKVEYAQWSDLAKSEWAKSRAKAA